MMKRLLGILVMGLMLVACGENEMVTSVPNTVVVVGDMAVPTTTPTSAPIIQPTVTKEPTAAVIETPTMYPTPTPMPTSTPLVPIPNPEKNYGLAEWTPERADQLITELQYLPETLNEFDRDFHNGIYHDVPRYTAFAQMEALSRFPTSDKVPDWQWDRAYNLAESNLFRNEPVVEIYADLLEIALNDELANSETLVIWLENQEPRLEYQMYSVPPPNGYVASAILEMASDDQSSGGYVWILETQSGYETYPLNSVWDFGFKHRHGIDLLLEDVTDDDIPEAFMRHFHQPGGPGFLVDTFDIFDLSKAPPEKIEFHSQPSFLGVRAYSSLDIANDDNNGRLVRFKIPADPNFCEPTTVQDFQWNGEGLILVNGIYPDLVELFQKAPVKDLPDCAYVVFKQVAIAAQFGDLDALNQLESLISIWPIREPDLSYRELDEYENYDTREKLEFFVGLLHALNGNVDIAHQYLEAVVNFENPESQWIEPAKAFLAVYQDKDDLVAGCNAAQICHDFFSAEILTILNLFDGENLEEANNDLPVVPSLDMKTLEFMTAELSETQDEQFANELIEALKDWPEFDDVCEDDASPLGHRCQNVYLSQYVTGLAYELTDREEEAVQVYYELWQNYPNSPYAMMAEAKLQEVGE